VWAQFAGGRARVEAAGARPAAGEAAVDPGARRRLSGCWVLIMVLS